MQMHSQQLTYKSDNLVYAVYINKFNTDICNDFT